jgi:hypothetical protein
MAELLTATPETMAAKKATWLEAALLEQYLGPCPARSGRRSSLAG